jgi:hypothetical protein
VATFVALLAAGGSAQAEASPPSALTAPQVIAHIGHGRPLDAQLAVAPNGRAAVLWARSPEVPRTAIELSTAKPNGRFSRSQTVAHVPFGPVHMTVAISSSGEVTAALTPEGGGLEVVRRAANGTLQPAEWIVKRPALISGTSIALDTDGAALLSWREEPAREGVNTPSAIAAAWREAGATRFGQPMNISSGQFGEPPQALFVAPGRGAVGFTSGSMLKPTGGALTYPEVAFANVGERFASPLVLANATGAALFAPDGEGGLFAAWTDFKIDTLIAEQSLWAARITSGGHEQTPELIGGAKFGPPSLSAAGRSRALLVWQSTLGGISAAVLGPGSASRIANEVPERQDVRPELAVDAAGAGVVAWARRIRRLPAPEAVSLQQVRYAVIPPGAHAFCAPHALGTSTEGPEIAMDGRGGGVILWIGTRLAGGPIQIARWRGTVADTRSCS